MNPPDNDSDTTLPPESDKTVTALTRDETAPGSTPPTHEAISGMARQIWMERGRPAGQDEAIWLEAEQRLAGRRETPESVQGLQPMNETAKAMAQSHDQTDSGPATRGM